MVENLESKAFYESILYFLREYKTHNNNDLKYIILTNTRDFYLIEAEQYRKFADDKTIIGYFNNCDGKEGVNKTTQKFYDDIKLYLPTLNATLKFTHFNIETTPLALLYQALSPQVLLKRKNCIDANTLNQNFYDELLYILGLKEISQNSKVLIQANDIKNTLLDSITKAFQLSPQDDFETIFSLLTTWNNRLLFLRLLESMLLSFKHIDKPFLDIDTLKSFTDLNTLFFEILAIKESKRQSTPKELDSIPYLNSSLFDKTELEKQNKEISKLDSNNLAIFKHSILKRDQNYKDTESLPLLEYLFAFLHAYDFTTTPKDIINHTKQNHDKLINAAVLGLVFEKLNGYKEGSFYTPSFITSYMCKESLEKVVIDKFNTAFNSNAKTINELPRIARDENKTIQDLRTILFSIKICDPSVGSGHFLVSALNELVLIAYRLGILESLDFQTTLELDNEEIIIKKQGKILEYTKPNDKDEPQHKIQQELFNLKKEIIESCLFGVDINPNSCEITKLRLWIELLKYSFYIFDSNGKNTNTLETLPNIDINIKCGNSLVSRFDLKDSLKHIPNITHQIERYKKLVFDYKNADQNILNISKQEIEAQIESIKQTFTLTLKDPKTKNELEKAIQTHITNYGISLLDNESLLDGLSYAHNIFGNPQLNKEQEDEAYISYGKIVALRKKLDSTTSGEGYTNAFEWRFAFPEVLDSNGDFLGFDLVIGNPPYIKEADNKKLFDGTRHLRTYQGKMDIWYHFVGKGFDIVKNKGIVSFIATNNWTTSTGAKNLRNVILKESQILNLVDFGSYMCFDSASIQTMIMEFYKIDSISKSYTFNYARIDSKKPTDKHRDAILSKETYENNIYLTPTITPLSFIDKPLTFADSKQEKVLNKILENGTFYLQENEAQIGIGLTDKVKKKMGLTNYKVGAGIFQISTQELKSLNLTESELRLIKPLYTSNELFRFYGNPNNNEWVIYTDSNFKNPNSMDKYPNLKKHLDNFRDVITSDNKPYGLHRAKQEYFFNKTPSIVSLRKCPDKPIFTYVDFDCYVTSTFFIIQTSRIDLKFLTGLLNSKLIAFWLKHKGKMQGNNYQIDKEPLLNIPIPQITESNKPLCDEIIKCVDKILESKAKDSTLNTSKLESKIDSLVYKLYNLTNDEIAIIERK
nr:Eco57I restriction-modification methylase domain-containing protein [uncultured Helicobacter sp.]